MLLSLSSQNQLKFESFVAIGTWFKRSIQRVILTTVIAFVTASFLLFPVFPISEATMFQQWVIPSAHAGIFSNILERIGIYTPPRKGTAPTGRRAGGAGRGPICALPENEQSNQVKALMPFQSLSNLGSEQENQQIETNSETEEVGGLTIAANPTFLFYLPYIYTPETPSQRIAQFVLLDDNNHLVWNELMAIELLVHPQLVEYPLSYSLETDKLYQWYFSVICDAEKLSRNPGVRGWIQRAEPTPELQNTLRNVPSFNQYRVYADNGFWFDAVSSLLKVRGDFPETNKQDWLSLLDYFKIPKVNQVDVLEPVEPTELEVVNGNQLPARM